MITLINGPSNRAHFGSLWFVIPMNLEWLVRPWLKSALSGITDTEQRVKALRAITLYEDGYPIYAKSTTHHAIFYFYTKNGEWRIGSNELMNFGKFTQLKNEIQLKGEILKTIESIADSYAKEFESK